MHVDHAPFLANHPVGAVDLSSPIGFRRRMPRFAAGALDANLSVVDAIESRRRRAGRDRVAGGAVRYRADELGVASVPIPGTPRASRVAENLGSLSVTLTPDQLVALDAASAGVSGGRSVFRGCLRLANRGRGAVS